MNPAIQPKKRGRLLVAYLLINFFILPLATAVSLYALILGIPAVPQPRTLDLLFWITLYLELFICSIAVWKWKKWGAYGIFIFAFFGWIGRLYSGDVNLLIAGFNLLAGVGLYYILFRSVWNSLE